ncbi:MAG: hypothetical protein V4579_01565 [Pseudomonadota bacterium]
MAEANRTTTSEDRLRELNVLVSQMRDHPSGQWDWARERAMVLRQMVAADNRPNPGARH